MRESIRRQLQDAQENALVVSFERQQFERGQALGYVIDIGPTFFLLLVIEHGSRFNGFQAMRIGDVSKLDVPHRHAGFVEAALRACSERMVRKPRVRVDSVVDLLESAGRTFPLVAIHCEAVDPEVCYIGKFLGFEQRKVRLREIDTDANWHVEDSLYRLKDITRVDFGGHYEEALHLVVRSRQVH